MNIEYTNLEKVLAIVLACLATGIWRLIGVIFYNKISEDGMLIKWINAVAYSMVSAVMMMILVYPSGILANTLIEHRLIALGIGILLMVLYGRLIYAILVSMISFGIFVTYL